MATPILPLLMHQLSKKEMKQTQMNQFFLRSQDIQDITLMQAQDILDTHMQDMAVTQM